VEEKIGIGKSLLKRNDDLKLIITNHSKRTDSKLAKFTLLVKITAGTCFGLSKKIVFGSRAGSC
jgi:hypothetical protein